MNFIGILFVVVVGVIALFCSYKIGEQVARKRWYK